MPQPETGRPSWRIRRRIIIATLTFCAGIIIYLLWKGDDTRLNQDIANGVLILGGSVIGAYVFGATWDDLNVMQHGRRGRDRGYRSDDYSYGGDDEGDSGPRVGYVPPPPPV